MPSNSMLIMTLYGFIATSILSCLIRCDYNLFFGFGILLILRGYYPSNPKQFGKIIIHCLCALIVVDIIWMIVMIPYWNASYNNLTWNSISGLRTFCIILSFVELGLKGFIAWVMLNDYKTACNNNIEDLFKLGYSGKPTANEQIL